MYVWIFDDIFWVASILDFMEYNYFTELNMYGIFVAERNALSRFGRV